MAAAPILCFVPWSHNHNPSFRGLLAVLSPPMTRMLLVGAGRIGRVHATAMHADPKVDLVGVVDPAPIASLSLEQRVPTFPMISSAAERTGATACVIAAPTLTHPELVRQALEAGLQVLCERPLALDPIEAVALGERALTMGRVLQVSFWRRYSPPWQVARRLVDEGAIGRPVLVRLSRWEGSPPEPELCDPAVSGGLLIDCGIQEFDMAEWLIGAKATSVVATPLPTVDPALLEVGDIDNSLTTVQLNTGTVAIIDLSRNARYGTDARVEILGSSGALFVDSFPIARLRIATAAGMRVVDGTDVTDPMMLGIATQLRAFAAACDGVTSSYPDGQVSARATELGILAGLSLRSGRTIALSR
jgi:myo-inositol 2-dehydrogenase/D-chiro-inositol 1-dehydrogenase